MKFRSDIQVYRGLAVFFVILFHLFPTIFKNGFLGVDVFFVISGFLMASLYPVNGQSNAKDFLLKRFNRIFPAYIFVLITFLLVSIFIISPYDYYLIIQQSVSSLFLVPNFYFWLGEDYFAANTYKPLIHFWSLGLELQFYLLVPFLTLLFRRNKLYLYLTFFISLTTCFFVSYLSQKTSFFILPFRVWEFLIGYFALNFSVYIKNKSPFSDSFGNIIGFLALFFLVAILSSSFNFGPNPGVLSLFTCIMMFLVISFPLSDFSENFIYKAFQVTGNYSYSLYLTHMPIIGILWYKPLTGIDFYNSTINLDVRYLVFFILCVLSSFFTYHAIERGKIIPNFFKRNVTRIFYVPILLSLFVFLLVPIKNIISGEKAKNITYAAEDVTEWRCGKVFKVKNAIFNNNHVCNINNLKNSKGKILLIGDSHANSMKYALARSAEINEYSAFLYDDSCNPGKKSCKVDILSKSINDLGVDKVVIHGLHYMIDFEAILKLRSLISSDIKFYFIKPIPIYKESVPRFLFTHIKDGDKLNLSAESVYKAYEKYKHNYSLLESNEVKLINTIDILCSPECKYSDDSHPYYYDNHHLTNTGAGLFINRLSEEIFQE